MKQPLRFMTVPKSFWDNEQLSLVAKWVAITIDSYVDNPHGTSIGVRAIQTATNLSAKEVRDAMTELYEHGAMEVTVCDGQKFWKPLLYRESYYKSGEKIVVGDKPSDMTPLPYEEIAEKWAVSCPHLPPIIRWSPQSKNKLRSAMKNAGLNLEQLYKCFKIVGATQFLNGTGDFKATFKWLTSKADNLEKVYIGFYARSYAEKSDYERIMRGGEVNQQSQADDEYYR